LSNKDYLLNYLPADNVTELIECTHEYGSDLTWLTTTAIIVSVLEITLSQSSHFTSVSRLSVCWFQWFVREQDYFKRCGRIPALRIISSRLSGILHRVWTLSTVKRHLTVSTETLCGIFLHIWGCGIPEKLVKACQHEGSMYRVIFGRITEPLIWT